MHSMVNKTHHSLANKCVRINFLVPRLRGAYADGKLELQSEGIVDFFSWKKKTFFWRWTRSDPVRTLRVQVQTNTGPDLRSRSRSAKFCLDRDRTGPWTVYVLGVTFPK